MSRFQTLFTEHPQKVGETYFQHLGVAGSFGLLFFKNLLECPLFMRYSHGAMNARQAIE